MRCLLLILLGIQLNGFAQSVARKWNVALMDAIRIDKARPTVQARNLYHVSAAMYDAWAVYDDVASPSMVTPKPVISKPADVTAARNEAISYAAFRLLMHRFEKSPGKVQSIAKFRLLLSQLGYDEMNSSEDYTAGSPAALGNYIAAKIIEIGLQDGSNETNDYANQFYQPVNSPLITTDPVNQEMMDCNRWQPLLISTSCDQNGIPTNPKQTFLSPEWGAVTPFALTSEVRIEYNKDGNKYWVYHDPGKDLLPMLDPINGASSTSKDFMWGFSLVSIWSSHLDQRDNVTIDISPASKGNVALSDYPITLAGLRTFYLQEGGDIGKGYLLNPKTGKPYTPQVVPRGDYTRVLAEFWADGPNSETPPGHWFTILNQVNDSLETKRIGGKGEVVSDLEWDVKAYLTMGGALHDAAITAWGIKGYYDGVRPISAIRYMAQKGQSTDPSLPHYHPAGIPLQPGFIELVKSGDPLAGANNENVNKIKLFSWRGMKWIPDPNPPPNIGCAIILDPNELQAGVGWILAENWVPYQRPTFVTPPFAGFISGHSTYSSAGAEVLTLLTGDEYFPGGLFEFTARKNEFLVFEEGPSINIKLQWARYKDASDQSSLSRIWGGIHQPADDMPGRLIGKKIGTNAFQKAVQYFDGVTEVHESQLASASILVYPNPVSGNETLSIHLRNPNIDFQFELSDILGRVQLNGDGKVDDTSQGNIYLLNITEGLYILKIKTSNGSSSRNVLVK